jgi:hypothetical protein
LALNVIAETIHFQQLLGRFRKSYARREFFSMWPEPDLSEINITSPQAHIDRGLLRQVA